MLLAVVSILDNRFDDFRGLSNLFCNLLAQCLCSLVDGAGGGGGGSVGLGGCLVNDRVGLLDTVDAEKLGLEDCGMMCQYG